MGDFILGTHTGLLMATVPEFIEMPLSASFCKLLYKLKHLELFLIRNGTHIVIFIPDEFPGGVQVLGWDINVMHEDAAIFLGGAHEFQKLNRRNSNNY